MISCILFRFVSLSLFKIFQPKNNLNNGLRVCLPGLNIQYSYRGAQKLIESVHFVRYAGTIRPFLAYLANGITSETSITNTTRRLDFLHGHLMQAKLRKVQHKKSALLCGSSAVKIAVT